MDDMRDIRLLDAIVEHSGMEIHDIVSAGEHGADAGWAGFTYTSDAADFYRANASDIDDMLAEDADDFGYKNVAEFVASFNYADMADTDDGRANLLAWYALESIGRRLADEGRACECEECLEEAEKASA